MTIREPTGAELIQALKRRPHTAVMPGFKWLALYVFVVAFLIGVRVCL